MEYQLDQRRGERTYKGRSEGMVTYVWMPRGSLGYAGVHKMMIRVENANE